MPARAPLFQALGKARRDRSRPLGLELPAERRGALRDRDLVAVPVSCASGVAAAR